jgi:hypothetical protein
MFLIENELSHYLNTWRIRKGNIKTKFSQTSVVLPFVHTGIRKLHIMKVTSVNCLILNIIIPTYFQFDANHNTYLSARSFHLFINFLGGGIGIFNWRRSLKNSKIPWLCIRIGTR